MADRYPLFHLDPADNLFRAPFLADQRLDKLPDRTTDTGLCLAVTPCQSQIMSLLGEKSLLCLSG